MPKSKICSNESPEEANASASLGNSLAGKARHMASNSSFVGSWTGPIPTALRPLPQSQIANKGYL